MHRQRRWAIEAGSRFVQRVIFGRSPEFAVARPEATTFHSVSAHVSQSFMVFQRMFHDVSQRFIVFHCLR